MTAADLDACREAFPAMGWTLDAAGKRLTGVLPHGRTGAVIVSSVAGKYTSMIFFEGSGSIGFGSSTTLPKALAWCWTVFARVSGDADAVLATADHTLTATALAGEPCR